MNLFLDDIRSVEMAANYMPPDVAILYRTKRWVIVRNYHEFVHVIEENGLPELVSFDHDLADQHYDPSTWRESFSYHEKTGLDCAKWMVDYCIKHGEKLPRYIVHSANPVGRENIIKYLENFRKHYE